jgi:hypothetical protein
MVSLTLTTCKRLDLFVQTIKSFVKHCSDIELFDTIIHYDDGVFSLLSKEEKQKVSLLVQEKILEKHLEYEQN